MAAAAAALGRILAKLLAASCDCQRVRTLPIIALSLLGGVSPTSTAYLNTVRRGVWTAPLTYRSAEITINPLLRCEHCVWSGAAWAGLQLPFRSARPSTAYMP
jgi:hypothetical protein